MKEKFLDYPITNTLIALNILIFLYMSISTLSINFDTHYLYDMGAINGEAIFTQGEVWRILSGIFLHASLEHIFMNMLSLWMIGYMMEKEFRQSEYLSIYLISGISGALSSIYMQPFAIGVGASGAIFGIFGAFGGYVIANRNHISNVNAHIKQFLLILGLNIGLGFMIPNIDMSAHLGGLSIGFIGGLMIRNYFKIYLMGSLIFIGLAFLYSRSNHIDMLKIITF